ncbi:hypothetical protein MTBBW1_410017 [Desulfamplus magnetovallimortis]|uniref:Uncharacterized protein n=1 Tax=Desulfamplus magnetovallimortis TaxID=1246637 RepID=A0A1W1HH04_9BACT|nr:hypothetical protein MTBBW1_410017 [Desulfamplus magnetovallimortis]
MYMADVRHNLRDENHFKNRLLRRLSYKNVKQFDGIWMWYICC